MKYRTLILGCLILCSTSFAVESLTLTDKEGNVTEGSITSYNPSDEIVKIKVKGQYIELPFSKFTAESQQEINGWLADKKFKSSSGLRIKLDDEVETNDTDSNQYIQETETAVYKLHLTNKSPIHLKDIKIEYYVFYEQEEHGSKDPAQKLCESGTMSCDLAPGEQREFKTKPVSVEDRTLTYSGNVYYTYGNGANKTSKGRIEGMLFRVTKPSLSGKLLTRDLKKGRVPKEKKWAEYLGHPNNPHTIN